MNLFDLIFLALLAIFTLLSYLRGMLQEIFTLIGLFGGFLVASWYSSDLADLISPLIPDSSISELLSFGLILLLGYYMSIFLGGMSDLFHNEPESGLARLGGGAIGFCKGLTLCLAVYWIVSHYIPSFQPELAQSWMGDWMALMLNKLKQTGII